MTNASTGCVRTACGTGLSVYRRKISSGGVPFVGVGSRVASASCSETSRATKRPEPRLRDDQVGHGRVGEELDDQLGPPAWFDVFLSG